MTDVMVRNEGRSRNTRRRARRARRTLTRIAVVVAGAAVLAAGTVLVTRTTSGSPGSGAGGVSDGTQLTVLVATTRADDPARAADSLTLFGVDRAGGSPTALLIPTGTFGQIPGQSSIEQVGKALTFGSESLQQTTIENLLGIVIGRTVLLSDVELAGLISDLGGIRITVVDRILETDAQGRQEVVFPLGEQHMDGPRAVTYMTYRGDGEAELDRAVRVQQVWAALIATGADADLRGLLLGRAAGIGQLGAQALAEVLDGFAAAPEHERSFDVLAVESVGGSALDEVFDLDPARVAGQIQAGFAGSRPRLLHELGTRPRVELRNGVGIPEVGSTAAALLVPEGFKIEVTGNTSTFDEGSTRIVVYGDDEASLALGERARALLGVGEVEVGTRGQTVVDGTIVIGRDFIDREA